MMSMTSNKPYLIRSIYEWSVDNDLTPYILVNAEYPGVEVPQEHVNAGRIILNISPKSCRGLHLDNDRILFMTRFSGRTLQLFVPPAAVLAIYAKENGRGMEFDEEEDPPPHGNSTTASSRSRGKPNLKLVE